MVRYILAWGLALGVLVLVLWKTWPRTRTPRRAHETPEIVEPAPGRPAPRTTPQAESNARPWRLAVEVRDPDDRPQSGALVRFLAKDGAEIDRGETNPLGVAYLRVRGAGRAVVTRVEPFFPARSNPVRPGAERVLIRLVQGDLAIVGRVFDADGEPVDATVAAKLTDPAGWIGEWRRAGSAVASPPGSFRIEGLRPGRYALVVRVKQSTPTRGRPPRDPVIAQAGDENVVIRLRNVAWLTFRWIDAETGAPIDTRRSVRWREGGEERVATASGPQTESSRLRAWIDHGPAALLTAAADGYRPLSLTVRLGADEWDRELTFRLAPDPESLVEVELLLRDSRGDPVREITIMRVFKEGGAGGTTYRSEDGRVVMTLPAGRNRLRFGPLIRQGKSLDRPWIVRFLDLDLDRASRSTVPVEMQRGGWLRQPRREGRLLRAARILGSQAPFVYCGPDDYRACLAPGRYTVEADLDDGRQLRGEVEITADRTSDVALEWKDR